MAPCKMFLNMTTRSHLRWVAANGISRFFGLCLVKQYERSMLHELTHDFRDNICCIAVSTAGLALTDLYTCYATLEISCCIADNTAGLALSDLCICYVTLQLPCCVVDGTAGLHAAVWRASLKAFQTRGAGETDLWGPELGLPSAGAAYSL